MERNESYLASFYIDRDVGAGVTLKPPLDLARIRPIMTIRLRLTLWYTALLGSTLILFSVLVYSALATNLWMQVEQDAARQANEVASALEQQLELDIFIVRSNPTRVQFPDLDFFASASGVQLVGLDGLIYKRSSNLGTLNVPVEKRLRQAEINLERWRWLKTGPHYHKLGGKIAYALADIEAYERRRRAETHSSILGSWR